ncbi:MAG: hypothetical protein DELT_02299 [Desulfovibrio sp.]
MTQKTEPTLLTIAELSRSLDLPESTTRYYCNRFAGHLPSVGEGRRRRYKPEALEKLRTIAETMRRDKNAFAVDLALRNEAAGGEGAAPVPHPAGSAVGSAIATVPALPHDAALAASSQAFASQMLALMENQTKALQDIAGAMSLFADKLSLTAQAPEQAPEQAGEQPSGERSAEVHDEIAALREQMRTAESVHQNDLEQLRKWLTRLGEALANK